MLSEMIKGGKTSVLTYAEKCKNILASNWQGYLNTVKADANGSKGEICTSKVRYFVKRGKPYIWVPENDMHNVNTMIDERGSFAVASPFPGPLPSFLNSIKKVGIEPFVFLHLVSDSSNLNHSIHYFSCVAISEIVSLKWLSCCISLPCFHLSLFLEELFTQCVLLSGGCLAICTN